MENRPMLAKLIIISILLFLGLSAMMLSCQPPPQQTVLEKHDSTIIRIVPIDSIQGTVPDIGQKLSIPNLDVEIFRVSESEVLLKTPVRTEVRTDVRIVETRRGGDRINVREVNKSRSWFNSRNRNSQNQDSGNKTGRVHGGRQSAKHVEKTRTVDKEVSRNGLPWWWLIIAGAVGGVYLYFKLKSPFPFP